MEYLGALWRRMRRRERAVGRGGNEEDLRVFISPGFLFDGRQETQIVSANEHSVGLALGHITDSLERPTAVEKILLWISSTGCISSRDAQA